ncbi:MAG: chromosomal replication initiator DnaA [Hyphomonas sp.]|nr:chromosomal replication initiator DnaA [Hyphomonas sp.]
MSPFDPAKDEDRAYLATALTAFALGLRVEDVMTGSRGTPVHARGRQIAMYLLRTGLGMSLARVARVFRRDRTTVSHACHLVEDLRDDPDFDVWVEQLTLGLTSVAVLCEQPETARVACAQPGA